MSGTMTPVASGRKRKFCQLRRRPSRTDVAICTGVVEEEVRDGGAKTGCEAQDATALTHDAAARLTEDGDGYVGHLHACPYADVAAIIASQHLEVRMACLPPQILDTPLCLLEDWILLRSDLKTNDLAGIVNGSPDALSLLWEMETTVLTYYRPPPEYQIKDVAKSASFRYADLLNTAGSPLRYFKKRGGVDPNGNINWAAGIYGLCFNSNGTLETILHRPTGDRAQVPAHVGINFTDGCRITRNYCDMHAYLSSAETGMCSLAQFFMKSSPCGPWRRNPTLGGPPTFEAVVKDEFYKWAHGQTCFRPPPASQAVPDAEPPMTRARSDRVVDPHGRGYEIQPVAGAPRVGVLPSEESHVWAE